MAVFLAVLGAVSLLVLVALLVALAKHLSRLTRAVGALQKEMLPALEEIQETSKETQRLASLLEERARLLRRDAD